MNSLSKGVLFLGTPSKTRGEEGPTEGSPRAKIRTLRHEAGAGTDLWHGSLHFEISRRGILQGEPRICHSQGFATAKEPVGGGASVRVGVCGGWCLCGGGMEWNGWKPCQPGELQNWSPQLTLQGSRGTQTTPTREVRQVRPIIPELGISPGERGYKQQTNKQTENSCWEHLAVLWGWGRPTVLH